MKKQSKEYILSTKKACSFSNHGCSITGASELHMYDDGGSMEFIMQEDGLWKKANETRSLNYSEVTKWK